MLKGCCSFVPILLAATVYFFTVDARPQFIEALNKVSEALNDTTISALIKTLTPNNVVNDVANRTKTRILFRGELSSEFGDHDVIFPDSYQSLYDNVTKIAATPKCARGKTFCEVFPSYPLDQVREILNRKPINTDLFGKDESPDDRYSITNRNGDYETFVCTSIQKTIFPRVGKNKNNKWKFIINQPESEGYVQGIRIEVCRNEGSGCDLIGERVNGYITSCKQKYMLRRMMSLSEDGDPVPDTFQLPSACCCSYRKDLSFLSRLGSEEISARTKVKPKD